MKIPLKAREKLEYIYVTSAIKGLYLIGELLSKRGRAKTMTVSELYHLLQYLVADGKGDYQVTCEAFTVGTDDDIEIDNDNKEISF